ncbi:family 16 glycoside hydrolase [Candidatus Oscillochloris fontis]|uniref:family 16 glycoside hydrolase n=1 Tax=Candidatus Oscillochloris fontis TaxID=2496868 RepID=UPI00101C92E8|nr:family 16 glycoside hydrolase [Candidatus Oscillochloris fontis]
MQRSSLLMSMIIGLLVLAGVGIALTQAPQGAAQTPAPLVTYPDFPPTPTVGPNPTAPAGLASSNVIFQSNFDDADALAAWQFVDQTYIIKDLEAAWEVSNGRLVQVGSGLARNPSTNEAAALVGDAAWRDYTIRTSFYDEYNGIVGLIARYQGTEPTQSSYYRVRLYSTQYQISPKVVLEKVVDGVSTMLAEVKTVGFAPRIWHTLALSVQGNSLQVQLDGQMLVTAQDPNPLPSGRAGLFTYAIGGIFFDDMSVVTP